ncbi:MAG TPA: metallophosphoesterase family protein [Thermoanaerobaculia bacterium]|nr:metallophosphoesterase family protein [Thermoanaerobaculia bacterium]
MRSLVVSDLHSNLPALTAVLKKVQRKRIDRIFCLGDFVGYGAHPNQVLDTMRSFKATKVYVRGNHDRVAAGYDEGEGFNHVARTAALWTRDRLSGPNRRFVRSLPVGPLTTPDGVMICHGSPADEDEYLFGDFHAAAVFDAFDAAITFFGHTHFPMVFALDENAGTIATNYIPAGGTFRLEEEKRYLVNPGSVGQPRDRNPHSSFAIFDDERRTVQFFRVPYDIRQAQTAILRAALPPILAGRLAIGT